MEQSVKIFNVGNRRGPGCGSVWSVKARAAVLHLREGFERTTHIPVYGTRETDVTLCGGIWRHHVLHCERVGTGNTHG